MGMGQRVQAQLELLGRRGLPLLDQAARSEAEAAFQRSMAGLPIRERSLRELESFRVVLAQRLHGLESRNLRHPLNFGPTPFGATKQNQNVPKPRRSRISMVCAFSPQRVCHSERRKESARSRSGLDAMLTATIPDGAAMIRGKRRQDSPFPKPKAAERYAVLHLQTVRARGRLPPVIHPLLRPDMNPRKAINLTCRNRVNLTTAREN